MKRLVYLLPALLFLGIGVMFYQGLGKDPSKLPSVLIDKPVPQFDLEPVVTTKPGLATQDLKGQVLLVNFFASWCGPCRYEHPLLMQIAAEAEVPLVGINVKDAPANVLNWLNQLGDPFVQIGRDLKGRVSIDWGVYGLPETFLVNKQGVIVYKHVGPLETEVLRDIILPLARKLQLEENPS